MAIRLNNPGTRHFNTSGELLSGGKLNFYEPGTTTPKDTYSDSTLSTPNANPVVLDSGGLEPNIFLSGAYRVILTDSDDVQVWDRDNVNATSGAALAEWSAGISYGVDDTVYGSDNNYYISLTSSNLGNDPTSSPSDWAQFEFINVTDAQATILEDIASITPTDSVFLVGDGSTFVSESGSTVRDSAGLGTSDNATFAAVEGTSLRAKTTSQATLWLESTGGATDEKLARLRHIDNSTIRLELVNDAVSASAEIMRATRSANVVSSINLGNSTDDPDVNFYGDLVSNTSGNGLALHPNSGFIRHSATNGITAGSTQTQAGATALTTEINVVDTVGTNGDGVKLPTARTGLKVYILNKSGNQLEVWPASGDSIDDGAVDAKSSALMGAGSSRTYLAENGTNWYEVD